MRITVSLVILSILLICGCKMVQYDATVSGTAVSVRADRSELGSGDKVYMTIESCIDNIPAIPVYRICKAGDPAPRVQKRITWQWPDSMNMMDDLTFPHIGDQYTFKLSPHTHPAEPALYIHFTAEVVNIIPAASCR